MAYRLYQAEKDLYPLTDVEKMRAQGAQFYPKISKFNKVIKT